MQTVETVYTEYTEVKISSDLDKIDGVSLPLL